MSVYQYITAAYLAAGLVLLIITGIQLKTGWRVSEDKKSELNDICFRLRNQPDNMKFLASILLTVFAVAFSAAVILGWPYMLMKRKPKV
ncbi:hypothetical protein ACJY8V_000956 [Escherichia coli]|nr:hypothetical protein [Escherichia coli]EFE3811438.1 hypothetical protein [Escherichia coli]EJF6665609.1 hypothetical protein [Escherichia coli]EJK1952080.1 hypothetical protein [Escherichia coli]HCN8164553.1 hypothetical protein [Escherichia coli]